MKKVAVSLHAIDKFDISILEGLKDYDFIHVDIMDGQFVEPVKLNLSSLKVIKDYTDKPIIAHLMVKKPLNYFNRVIDYCNYFVFHYESSGNPEKLIQKVKKAKKQVGIAINPDTPLVKLIPFLNKIDLALIMSVHPGYSGQTFIWECLDKMNLLIAYRAYMKIHFLIDIDGGITLENAGFIHSDIVSSASTILKADDPNLVIQKLKEIEYDVPEK